MGVLHNAILLARSVSATRVYRDLVAIESDPPVFGIHDQTVDGGVWIEQFDRQECVNRLREWPIHHNRPGVRLPYSAVTELGERWLTSQTM